MPDRIDFDQIRAYFHQKYDVFGTTPQGADWNSIEAQEIRFEQLTKIIRGDQNFSILDYGCGFGSYADFLLKRDYPVQKYFGYDLLESLVDKGAQLHGNKEKYQFTNVFSDIPMVDYAVASGVFNIKLDISFKIWTEYVIDCLDQIHGRTIKGFSVNFLTKYSDAEKMNSRLYYADPLFLFDYCKTHFSRNVALLHDYQLYDFTILLRKPA